MVTVVSVGVGATGSAHVPTRSDGFRVFDADPLAGGTRRTPVIGSQS